MDSRDYKGFSLLQGTAPPDCQEFAVVYQPNRLMEIPVGFVLFEARFEPRKTSICFSPHLELAESIAMAIKSASVKNLITDATSELEKFVENAKGPNPVMFPQFMKMPSGLVLLGPNILSGHPFDYWRAKLEEELFAVSSLWEQKSSGRRNRNGDIDSLRTVSTTRSVECGATRLCGETSKLRIPFGLLWLTKIQHAVSIVPFIPCRLSVQTNRAEFLISNFAAVMHKLREKLQGDPCEMHAVVENFTARMRDYRSGLHAHMKHLGIYVDSVSHLPELAATARSLLRLA